MTAHTDGDAKRYFDAVNVSPCTSYTFSDYYKYSAWTNLVAQYTHQDNSVTYEYFGGRAASSSWSQATYSFTTYADLNVRSEGRGVSMGVPRDLPTSASGDVKYSLYICVNEGGACGSIVSPTVYVIVPHATSCPPMPDGTFGYCVPGVGPHFSRG